MTEHSTSVPLRDMLDHAREAVTLIKNRSRADLDSDRLLNLGLVRLLEIVGEAARRVPGEIQRAHPEIPWPEIVGLRNRLIHGYGSIDFDVVWQIVAADLPPLIAALEMIVEGRD